MPAFEVAKVDVLQHSYCNTSTAKCCLQSREGLYRGTSDVVKYAKRLAARVLHGRQVRPRSIKQCMYC